MTTEIDMVRFIAALRDGVGSGDINVYIDPDGSEIYKFWFGEKQVEIQTINHKMPILEAIDIIRHELRSQGLMP